MLTLIEESRMSGYDTGYLVIPRKVHASLIMRRRCALVLFTPILRLNVFGVYRESRMKQYQLKCSLTKEVSLGNIQFYCPMAKHINLTHADTIHNGCLE